MKYKKLFIYILIILNHGNKRLLEIFNRRFFFREEFDKDELSESTNLINELVIATDIRKV
jgi:hypothetical protein